MTSIHPGPDQTIGTIARQLEALGLVYQVDFWLHYTWDMRPFVQTTPQAYETWESSQDNETKDQAGSGHGAGSDKTRAGSSRRATNRR